VKRFLPPVLLVAALVGYLISATPRGFSTDLSKVGEGKTSIVAVHDVNIIASTALMDVLQRVHDRFEGHARFLVADVNTRDGRAFAERHGAGPGTLLVIDSGGSLVARSHVALDETTVITFIEGALTR